MYDNIGFPWTVTYVAFACFIMVITTLIFNIYQECNITASVGCVRLCTERNVVLILVLGPFKCYVLVFWKLDTPTPTPPCNANNVGL